MSLADQKAPVCRLEIAKHFDALTETEKLYAHHMSRASHLGTRVVLRQVSEESESIYDLVLAIATFADSNWSKFGLSDEDLTFLLDYFAQFLANLGNYTAFGDAKFVPRITREKFEGVASAAGIDSLFARVADEIYSTEPAEANLLGYKDKGHASAYYAGDITTDEILEVNKLLADKGIMPENTRVFKTHHQLVVKIASADVTGELKGTYKTASGFEVSFEYGDSNHEFEKIAGEIKLAQKYAANQLQKDMLEQYYISFKTGSMSAHKESQKLWVKDIGPKVETNIGFIETYRDPSGVRGEWEGLVAMVNKERTEKFSELVSSAYKYIPQLPWPKDFEKAVFTPPDFTSLEVLTFAGSGCPAGINIPNYDDVRENVGFKNVSLGNVLNARTQKEKTTFIADEDQELYDKLFIEAFEVQVGIHELLGHGTGKLLTEQADGTFNFDKENPPISPLTNKPVTTYYQKGQTWGSLFGALASPYEECRAECVAMYLATDFSLLKIFGHTDQAAEDILYISYLQMARAGLVALEFWNPKSNKWGQAHMNARYTILQCFLQAGEGFVKFEYTKDDFSDLVIKLDRSKIKTVGMKAVGDYLQKLHIYKTTGDAETGKKFFNEMSEVTDMAKFRDAVIKAKKPRKQLVQANTVLENGKPVLKEYDETSLGLIQSFLDRKV